MATRLARSDQGDGAVDEGNEQIGEVSPVKLESEGIVDVCRTSLSVPALIQPLIDRFSVAAAARRFVFLPFLLALASLPHDSPFKEARS